MDDLHMNRTLGTKWFTFYTKVRPCVACLATLGVVVNFLTYTEIYLQFWWIMVQFVLSILLAVLSVLVFIKSRGNYIKFVEFVEQFLLIEILAYTYSSAINQYIKYGRDLVYTFIFAAVNLLLSYLLWYRLNVKYFRKRIAVRVRSADAFAAMPDPVKDRADYCAAAAYCRRCGKRLPDDSKFCNQCGTQV